MERRISDQLWCLFLDVDGTLLEELDVAPPGKDFASYLSATLTKK